MARSFGNSTSNYLSRATSLVSASNPRPISVSVWLRANNNGVTHTILCNNASNGPNLYLAVRGGDVMSLYSGGYVDSMSFTLSTSAWTHLGWTWDTDDAVAFYLNGVANGTASRTVGGNTDEAAEIGTLHVTGGFDVDGDLAEFAAWNAILGAADFAALAKRYSPRLIRLADLVSHVSILGRTSPEPDVIGGTAWTINGTLTQAAHPPMMMPTRPQIGLAGVAAPAASTSGNLLLLGVG